MAVPVHAGPDVIPIIVSAFLLFQGDMAIRSRLFCRLLFFQEISECKDSAPDPRLIVAT